MTLRRILWTNRNPDKATHREQSALDFIKKVQDSAPDYNFSSVAKEFLEIPEIHIFNQKFPDLSDPAKKLFEKIYSINAQDPEIGLKVITILASNIECAFYSPKLKEIVFQRLREWLLSDKLPRRTRLEWGLYCWKNWPVRHPGFDSNEFVEPLLMLFIQESEFDAEYTLDIYDSLFKRRSNNSYIFNQFREDPEDFLLFSRNVHHIRPKFLTDALMRFIRDGKRGLGGYIADIKKLNLACEELFSLTEKNQNINLQELEIIFRELILYSYPELPWYNKLHDLLWDIQKRKASESRSIRDHLILSVNCPKESNLIEEIRASYKQWLTSYKTPGWLSINNVINHTKEMIELVNFSLNAEHPITRNRSISVPNNDELIKDSIFEYWQMIEYLKQNDFELYLYALETAMEKPTFTVSITEEIGDDSKLLLLSSFKEYCIENIDKAALLITYMISRSAYTEIGKNIGDVLDLIYPILSEINKETAEICYQEGTKHIFGHSSMGLWRPKNNFPA